MKKKISMIVAMILIATFFVAVGPKVEASAKSTYEMSFNEVVDFWSSTGDFLQIYYMEYDKSPYIYDVKMDVKKYFAASLVDYVQHPNELAATRPYTYNYMVAVMSKSDPNLYYVIAHGDYAHSLPEMILDEMNVNAPYLTYEQKTQNVPVLVSFLNSQGVYTVDQYKNWKNMNGGKTAFEVYMHHISDASDAWVNAQNAQWQAIQAQAAQAQAEVQQQIADAQAAQQQMQENLQQQIADAQAAQQEAFANMFN